MAQLKAKNERVAVEHYLRAALMLFLVLLTYDGVLRKWVGGGLQASMFIVKDVLLLGMFGMAVIAVRESQHSFVIPRSVKVMVFLYAIWVFIQCFNPRLPNMAVGIWGAKSHLLYASLMVLVPLAFRDLQQLLAAMVRVFPWIAIPVCGIAMAQVYAPADSFLNTQLGDDLEGIAYFGDAGLVRVSGTFSYLSGMAAFIQVVCLVGFALYLGGGKSWLMLVSLGFVAMALPTSGSRSVIAIVGVGVAVMMAGALLQGLLQFRVAFRMIVLFAALVALNYYTQVAVWEALYERYEGSKEEGQGRLFIGILDVARYIEISGATGFGSGAANIGAIGLTPGIRPYSWLPAGIGFEEELGRIVLELGWIGFALSMSFRVMMVLWAAALFFQSRSVPSRVAVLLALPFLLLGVYLGNGVFSASYMAVIYWFCCGLLAMAQAELAAQSEVSGRPVDAKAKTSIPSHARQW